MVFLSTMKNELENVTIERESGNGYTVAVLSIGKEYVVSISSTK